jgi:site-specific recombinase XerD
MASIRERVSKAGETTWAVLYRHGGKQSSKPFSSEKHALAFKALIDLHGVEAALALLDGKPAEDKPITLDDLAAKWLEARQRDVDAGDLTPRVLTGYRRDYENWISPWLGSKAAAEVTEADVQKLVDHMKGRISAKSVADRHAVLHSIYKWASAKARGYVDHNPCKETALPRRTKKPPKGLRLPELHALTTTARKIDPEAADLIDFIAGTGWRIGESIALTAGQVEDDGVSVYVSMDRVWRREVGFVEGAKSDAGLGRRLQVLGPAVGVLRRRIVGLDPADLVFTTAEGKPWDESGFRRDHWKKITVAAGLGGGWMCECGAQPTSLKRVESHTRATGHKVDRVEGRNPTPHWLRHSHVLICHAAGMDLAQIQRRLGHADIQMTINTYGRLIDGMSEDVAQRLDALLTPGALPEVVSGEVVGAGVRQLG